MHWELLFPVIIVLIWIVNSFLRGNEEEKPGPRRRPLPGNEARPGQVPRRPVSDIDRFLEEINRRRRESIERRPSPAPRETVVLAEPIAPPPARSRPPSRPSVPRPAAKPAPKRPSLRMTEREPVVEVLPIEEPAPAPPPSAYTFPVTGPSTEPAAGQKSLQDLLRSREGLAAAFLLQEILGPPLCKRHR